MSGPAVLGTKPLCEASGAVFLPCGKSGERCLLVADNEQKSQLFLFDVDGAELTNQRAMPLLEGTQPAEIKDAEGLTNFGGDVFVVGSHSRRSWDKKDPRCTTDDQRRVFALLRRQGDAFQTTPVRTDARRWRHLLQPAACADLIATKSAVAAPLADRVCVELADGDLHAEESREACARALNIEGVAAVPGSTERLWFGLRGPLVDDTAILLRLASLDALGFDAVVSLDLAGDGVRDLTYANGWLWVLAGPAPDEQKPGSIWRIAANELVDGARLRPTLIKSDLPPFSEALAIDPATGDAFVLVDGDEENGPGDPNGCPIPARYLYLRLS